MTSLLEIKEKIVGFYKNYEYFVNIVAKFILAYLAFSYINSELGYYEAITGLIPTVFISAICAVVPISIFVLLFAAVIILHLFKLSVVLAAVAIVLFLLFYLIYLKFAPDQGIMLILYPVLARYNLQYMIPLIGAMAFNPFAAIPIAFAVIFVKIIEYIKLAADVSDLTMDIKGIVGSYQFIFDKLLSDKEIMIYIGVFTVVIIVTYVISRFSFSYAWYAAILVGAVINIVGFTMQINGLEGANIGMIIVGTVAGALVAVLAIFAGCTLDYGRREMLQFEDDDYYYYVKAIPKIHVTEAERTVKTFTKKEAKVSKKDAKAEKKKAKKAVKTTVKKETSTVAPDTKQTLPKVDTPVAADSAVSDDTKVRDFDELSFDGFDFDDLDK